MNFKNRITPFIPPDFPAKQQILQILAIEQVLNIGLVLQSKNGNIIEIIARDPLTAGVVESAPEAKMLQQVFNDKKYVLLNKKWIDALSQSDALISTEAGRDQKTNEAYSIYRFSEEVLLDKLDDLEKEAKQMRMQARKYKPTQTTEFGLN